MTGHRPIAISLPIWPSIWENHFYDDDDDDDEDYDGECSYRVPLSRCYHHAALVVCQPLCAPVVHSSLGRIYCARPIVAEFYSIPLLGTVVLVFLRLSWLSNSSWAVSRAGLATYADYLFGRRNGNKWASQSETYYQNDSFTAPNRLLSIVLLFSSVYSGTDRTIPELLKAESTTEDDLKCILNKLLILSEPFPSSVDVFQRWALERKIYNGRWLEISNEQVLGQTQPTQHHITRRLPSLEAAQRLYPDDHSACENRFFARQIITGRNRFVERLHPAGIDPIVALDIQLMSRINRRVSFASRAIESFRRSELEIHSL